MPFPFVTPLKETIVTKLKKREKEQYKQNIATTYSPFAILSSAAVVLKAQDAQIVKNIIATESWPKESQSYYGCVINNSTEIKNQYQTGATIAGYDLNGKPIYVEQETNRRVSLPIITDIEIDTDGNNNTLKTANVNIKVFTLKQLEMFEMFFLRPAMDVVLEFGYNSDIRGEYYNKIQQNLFVGQGYNAWEEKFLKQYSHKNNAYKLARENYLTILKETDYNYDFFAGKILGFSFSPSPDGTYDVKLEISAGNELQQWAPLKQSSPVGKLEKASEDTMESYSQWMNVIATDLNLPKLLDNKTFTKNYIKAELFNWGVINKDEKDTNVSKDPYISFKFALDILNASKNIQTYQNGDIQAVYYEDASGTIPIIPVSSHKNVMSTTATLILPGDLPKILIANLDGKKDEIVLDETKRIKCKLNDKSFNIESNSIYDDKGEEIKLDGLTIGNLYNVFIKYEIFVKIFNDAYIQADIMNELLAEINFNMFGLCKLELQKIDDSSNAGPLTIGDRKLKNITKNFKEDKEIYRFKIGPIGSIVQEFNFNMEMSELMQGQAMFSQMYDMMKIQETGDIDNIRTDKLNEENSPADLSLRPNIDGYCSINKMQHALNKDYKEWQNEIKTLIPGIAGDEPVKKDTEDTSKSLEKLYQTFRGNYVKFKLNANDRENNTETGLNHLIYTDASLIQHYIPRRESGTTVLTFLDISLAIDGMSGLSCGEYFQIDGIPEVYNKNGYFQITNVKHSLNENQWKTVIEASYLLKSIDVPGSKTNLNDGKAYKERPVPPEKPKIPIIPTPKPTPYIPTAEEQATADKQREFSGAMAIKNANPQGMTYDAALSQYRANYAYDNAMIIDPKGFHIKPFNYTPTGLANTIDFSKIGKIK